MLLTLAVLLAATVALESYVLWGKSRRRRARFIVPSDASHHDLMPSLAALTYGRVSEGNAVKLVQNSAFFDALLDDLASARHHVHLETFLWHDGAVSDRVSGALIQRARAGVEVRVLVDQRGGKQTSSSTWQAMTAAGVDLRVYHRLRFGEFARYNHRDHRKIAVIDGHTGYTFGHGIADMWGPSTDQPNGWRDTAARIEGPAVGDLQAAFFENWIATTGEAVAGTHYFRPLARAGPTPVHVAWVSPRETQSAVQRLYYLAIASARGEIILQNPYFLPDRQAVALMAQAVTRGVKISIMLPTADTSDFAIVQHASHHFYGPLLAMGVRVWEHVRSGLHQKVMIVDGTWCSIGSTNFDPRSFRLNSEITLAMVDERIAQELRAAFEADCGGAEEWTLARWKGRDAKHKLIDAASALCKRQL
jgi:cardiolipin synthase